LERGFTLAEVLIVLGLLGLIATFAIPKVMQAQGTAESTSKLKETVATLEAAWSELKTQNSFTVDAPLYDSLITTLNDARHDTGPAGDLLGAGHPCAAVTGYVQLATGVVVTGLYNTDDHFKLQSTVMPQPSSIGGVTGDEPSNYFLCIDINGPSGPNAVGSDVFGGNFNQSGNFDGTGNQYAYGDDTENFCWGGKEANDYIWLSGTPGQRAQSGTTFGDAPPRVGSRLY
jgi:prepilin-type N-terminal cleavage/methylation domain-containing protein